jgi:hypothetical protein
VFETVGHIKIAAILNVKFYHASAPNLKDIIDHENTL